MNAMFEVFLEFCGQKYDICINDYKQTISFRDIYPKLQQVIKISANEDIDFITHDFEILNPGAINHFTVKNLDVQVKNHSVIRIEGSKSREEVPPPREVLILREVPALRQFRQEVENFHSIVMAINIGWDFRKKRGQAKHNWKKLSQILKRNYKQHRPDNIFFKWIKYYAQNYEEFEGKISPSSQKTFDLLKVVHVLDLDQFNVSNISSDTQDRIKAISQTVLTSDYYRQHLAHIREKKIQEKEDDTQITNNNKRGLDQLYLQWRDISRNEYLKNSTTTALTEQRNDEKRQRSH